MPNLATLLKEEISKIVRKEVQDQVRELQKTVREQRDALARLEKQVGPAKAKAAAKSAAAKPAATKPAAAKPAAAKPAAAKPAAAKVSKAPAGDKEKTNPDCPGYDQEASQAPQTLPSRTRRTAQR